MLFISFLSIINDISLSITNNNDISYPCQLVWVGIFKDSKFACGEGNLMVDCLVKATSFQLKRMDIVKDEPAISHRRTTVPGSYRTGDRFAGRRVVTIGGGSGTFSVLSHLKKYPFNISAIVTMSDSGGSSRMLMDEFHRQLPLGDLRMSLVALARNGALWREVFMHRFELADDDASEQNRGVGG